MDIVHPPSRIDRIERIGSELALRWSDGVEAFIPLERLRLRCPCAACGGEPDLLNPATPTGRPIPPAGGELTGFRPVGNYAIQFTWGDGHNTGIYSHSYLRQLAAVSA